LIASVTPNESDSAEQEAFDTFNTSLGQDLAEIEQAKRRRSKMGAIGLEKAERITAWENRQTTVEEGDEVSTGRRTLTDFNGFDSDDDDSDNDTSSSDESADDRRSSRRIDLGDRRKPSNSVEMIDIKNPLR